MEKHPGFQIIGDNVDVYVKACHERMNCKAKRMHRFQIYPIITRISGSHLPNHLLLNNILTVPNSIFIPTVSVCLKFRSHLIILCSRIMIKYCPFFVEFTSCVEKHIIHNYSAEMSKPSEIVRTIFHLLLIIITHFFTIKIPLGVIWKQETKGDEMIDIVENMYINICL